MIVPDIFPTYRPAGKTTLLALAIKMREDMNEAQRKKQHFLYQKVNAEFDWSSAEWKSAMVKNKGHMSSIKFANVGKYRYNMNHKLRKLLQKLFYVIFITYVGLLWNHIQKL